MNFQVSKTHELLRRAVRDFAQKEVKPIAKELDEQFRYPHETIDKFFKYGYMSFYVPQEENGTGGDTLGYAITIEELAKCDPVTSGILSGHNESTIAIIHREGNAEQRAKYLPQLMKNRMGGFSLTEPTAGSDSNGLQATAISQGDYYLANGTKCFVTNGGKAEIFILMALSDPTIKGSKGKSAFILDSTWEGVSKSNNEVMMGFHSSSITELRLNNVKIPKENLIGEEGRGMQIALGDLDGGRIIVASEAVGAAQSAIDEAIAFANKKKINGTRVSMIQNVQFKLAELQAQVDAARLLVYRAAWMHDAGIKATREASEAKFFGTQTGYQVTSACVGLLGQYGYTHDYPVERFMRDTKLMEIYEGTNQIQKMIISRTLGLIVKEPKTEKK